MRKAVELEEKGAGRAVPVHALGCVDALPREECSSLGYILTFVDSSS